MDFWSFCKSKEIEKENDAKSISQKQKQNKAEFRLFIGFIEEYLKREDVSVDFSYHTTHEGHFTFMNFIEGEKMKYRICHRRDGFNESDYVSFWDLDISGFEGRYTENTKDAMWLPFVGWMTVLHHKNDGLNLIDFVNKHGKTHVKEEIDTRDTKNMPMPNNKKKKEKKK